MTREQLENVAALLAKVEDAEADAGVFFKSDGENIWIQDREGGYVAEIRFNGNGEHEIRVN